MIKISALVQEIANTLGLPHSLVSSYARRLVDAGLLPKSIGRRYAQALPEHAAALLIALLTTDQPSDGPRNVMRYGQMTTSAGKETETYRQLLPFITALIDGASKMDRGIIKLLWNSEIRFQRKPGWLVICNIGGVLRIPKVATLYFMSEDTTMEAFYPSLSKETSSKKSHKIQKFSVEACFHGGALISIGAFLAGVKTIDALKQTTIRQDHPQADLKQTLDRLLPKSRR